MGIIKIWCFYFLDRIYLTAFFIFWWINDCFDESASYRELLMRGCYLLGLVPGEGAETPYWLWLYTRFDLARILDFLKNYSTIDLKCIRTLFSSSFGALLHATHTQLGRFESFKAVFWRQAFSQASGSDGLEMTRDRIEITFVFLQNAQNGGFF